MKYMTDWKVSWLEKNKFLSMLGISKKAGKLVAGYDPVEEAIIKKKIVIVILSNELSEKNGAKIKKSAEKNNIPVKEIPFSMEEIGWALGSKPTGILGISDNGLAHILEKSAL